MTNDDHPRPEPEEDERDVFDLDLDADETDDTEEVLREAVAAVEARQRQHEEELESLEAAAEAVETMSEAGERSLEEEVSILRERALRTLADYENYRKRSEREREELRQYAGADILRKFLDIVDNLERALAATGSLEDLTQGVGMIHRQMQDLLRRSGVEAIEAEGHRFDPLLHEAVASQVDPSLDEPVVLHEMQRGYQLYDRLLRPSIVRVAMPPEERVEAEASGSPPSGDPNGEA